MEAQLDPLFQSAVDSKKIPGACAVALDASGEVLFSKGYGYTLLGDTSSPPITPDTPGLIWSCTKLVTSVAALQLVEQGKLDIYDDVDKYVPVINDIMLLEEFNDDGTANLRPPKNKVKMIHLFTHTSGLSYDFLDPTTLQYRLYSNEPPAQSMSRSVMADYTTPLIFEPGTAYCYGVNNEYMGWVIEKISGIGLGEYIEKNIAQPLGLKDMVQDLVQNETRFSWQYMLKTLTATYSPHPSG